VPGCRAAAQQQAWGSIAEPAGLRMPHRLHDMTHINAHYCCNPVLASVFLLQRTLALSSSFKDHWHNRVCSNMQESLSWADVICGHAGRSPQRLPSADMLQRLP
jgi:hypothetical protein